MSIIPGIVSGGLCTLLGVALGYFVTRSMQQREWKKQALEKSREQFAILKNSIIAVQHEMLQNLSYLESMNAQLPGTLPSSSLSTFSFEASWPVFTRSTVFAEDETRERQFQIINRMFYTYNYVNRKLGIVHDLEASGQLWRDPAPPHNDLKAHVQEALRGSQKDEALDAATAIRNYLDQRINAIDNKLRRHECWLSSTSRLLRRNHRRKE